MPQDAGHAFCRCAMTFNAPFSLFYIFGCNINDSHYYYYCYKTKIIQVQWYYGYFYICTKNLYTCCSLSFTSLKGQKLHYFFITDRVL